ncbi:BglG family transcription antiterminator [Propionispira raffinosivorans]|uniref:BglG family transcription antiterminator n=1 Tax=Propionispira raffinosivorans TaxID=86959 RepID=UPI00037F5D3F|nr:PRD domain-containing protein [Propionispira raffinosivorans]
MNGKNKQVIKILLDEEDPITASSLADKIGVSARSVINYISEINFFHPDLIKSSRNGYCIHKQIAKKLYRDKHQTLPQAPEERINCLLLKILMDQTSKENGIDLHNFADDICVSMETIKKDLVNMKKKLAVFEITINVTKGYITLIGTEQNKRNLFSNIIYENFDKYKLSVLTVKQIFPDAPIDPLYQAITTQCRQHHYFIHDCWILNLVLDLLIAIYRIQQGYTLKEKNNADQNNTMPASEFTNQITTATVKFYNIKYNHAEIKYLNEIIVSYIIPADLKKIRYAQIDCLLEPECKQVLNQTFAYIKKMFYFIDLKNERFLVRFALNVNNLLYRLRHGHWIHNPQKEDMKLASPFYFKCAVNIAYKITEQTGLQISEDETAPLALHLGLNINEQRNVDFDKIRCGLMITHYFDYDEDLIKVVQRRFANDIIISDIFRLEKQMQEFKDIDLLISTVPLPESFKFDWVTTDPFLSDKNIEKISRKIAAKKLQQKQKMLHNELIKIGSELLFYRNKSKKPIQPAIAFTLMHTLLIENNYLDGTATSMVQNYGNDVIPTYFGHIAVPDILSTNVKKTGIVIILNEHPSIWANNQVDIVIMLALNQTEWEKTSYVFDTLIGALREIENLNQILKCKNYAQFVDTIVNLIE